uniref:Core-binding (CB) domain-containing protein n=1 Tax=Streptomyces sp. NBC_00003 TaxID=2903608 RepID=A0AAU2VBY3_9ACTN
MLPPAGFHAPDVLEPGSLVVWVTNKEGHRKPFDFSKLSVAEPMQLSLARLFARQAKGWNSHDSARRYWEGLLAFTRLLSELESPPGDLDELTVAQLKRWRQAKVGTNGGRTNLGSMRTLLRLDARLSSGPVSEEIVRRVPGARPSKQSFEDDERERVLAAARREFRAAWLRITENHRLLMQWQAGEIEEGSREWRIGTVLDHLARTGDVPRTIVPCGGSYPTNRRLLGGTSMERTWGRLFLSRRELTSMAVLLTDKFAWNHSLYNRMPAPSRAPSAGESRAVTYQVMTEKRRASGGRWYSSENVTDFGADSAGRLITQALQATAPGRELAAALRPGTDFLMTARTNRPGHTSGDMDRPQPVGWLVFGLSKDDSKNWSRHHQAGGSPFGRLRRTTVTREGRPLQHSQGTHESVYVIPDKRVQRESRDVFADGAQEARAQAETLVFEGKVDDQADPAHAQTATTDCEDPDSSPWPAPGGGCGADFLLCLACTNAHVHPGHHPRLAHLHQQIRSLSDVTDEEAFAARWRSHLLRLEDLERKIGPTAWKGALARVTERDRTVVALLLEGDLAP